MTFYVYELVDSRDGSTFYIGKGKGNRMHAHEAEAKRGVYSAKCQRIREILSESAKVEKRVLSRFQLEHEAYEAERELIAQIGLENLTNVLPGGIHIPRKSKPKAPESKFGGFHGFLRLAPSLARAIREYARGNSFMWGGMDLSKFAFFAIAEIAEELGAERTSREMEKYGVTLNLVEAGA